MNRKGFTLVEVLAVVIILGVIMTIAVPNVLGLLERNKKNTFIENAKTMATMAEYTLRKDTSIDYPKNNGDALILTLEYLNTDDISTSPYGTSYSPSKSFVAIVNETTSGVTEYKYYVHLVACTDIDCTNSGDNSVAKNAGINLANIESLSSSNKLNRVKKGVEVNTTLGMINGENKLVNDSEVRTIIKAGSSNTISIFNKLR